MGDNLLTARDLEAIKKWIKKLEKEDYKPKEAGDTCARTKLKLPYKEIGAGKNRIVFDMKNGFVLKVAISVRGIANNETEAMLYRSVKSSLQRYLAKVVEHGYGWIIMEKLHKKVSDNKKNRDKVLKLQDKFIRNGITLSDLIHSRTNEPKWNNIRLRSKDQSITIIDFGCFKEKASGTFV